MKRFLTLCCGLALTWGLAGCDVDVAEDGRAPSVDVDVKADPGNVPDVDVEGPTVTTEKVEVDVPKIKPAPEGSADAEEGEN